MLHGLRGPPHPLRAHLPPVLTSPDPSDPARTPRTPRPLLQLLALQAPLGMGLRPSHLPGQPPPRATAPKPSCPSSHVYLLAST